MRTMRMEREDIENSLKVLSHIVDDDFIITVDEARKIIGIDGETIEALQIEIKRLKDSNEELREKQTYIDHYGTEWLTSAKDVPNYAYEHGYADGMAEVKTQLPKRGDRCDVCRSGNLEEGDTLYKSSDWDGGIGFDYIRDIRFCPICGRKLEVQE